MTDQDIMNLRERVRERLDALGETLKLKKQHAALSALRESLNEYDAGWVGFLEERLAGETETGESDQEVFEALHGRLVSLADGFSEFARHHAERPCGAFKARQFNAALRPLRDLLAADAGVSLPLVSEEEQNTYSDVSLLLCAYLGFSASYAKKHFDLKYDARGHEVTGRSFGYGRRA
ncbi:MAG: hypothetical protein II873_09570 [Oscillospiraceae bacterium]|nr:hypothetical protein [Oscillospiraceae bacterium]